MSDAAVAAEAAPEPVSTPAEQPAQEQPKAEPKEPAIDKGPMDAIDRAFEAVDKADKPEPKEKPKQEAKAEPEKKEAEAKPDPEKKADDKAESDKKPAEGERERNPDGTFKAKEAAEDENKGTDDQQAQKPKDASVEAPTRFSEDARKEWEKAPQAVRSEVVRMQREMEAGIERFRADANAFQPYKQLDQHLQQNGQTLQQVFQRYSGIEQLLQKDIVAGLDKICRNKGLSLQQVVTHLTGQEPNQQSAQQDQYIHNLEQKIDNLERQLGGFTNSFQSQKTADAQRQVEQFMSTHPRFEELSEGIAKYLKTGAATDLQEAYDMAEAMADRGKSAPQAVQSAQPQTIQTVTEQKPDAAQTREKEKLSLDGSPNSGQRPEARELPKSAEEAVNNAFARLSL